MLTATEKRTLDAAAAKGARRLDARRSNWFNDIHTPSLRLNNCSDCVCGQLYGDFDRYAVESVVGGWVSRLIRGSWMTVADRYGFDVPADIDDHPGGYDHLTKAWKREIFARRRAAAEAA